MEIEKIVNEMKKKPILIEYLTPAKKGYVCPVCGNGSGEDGTGAVLSEDGTRLLCGKCQRGLTNIDVLANYLGLGTTGADYVEVVKYGAEKLGIEPSSIPPIPKEKEKKEQTKKELAQIIESDIEKAQVNLKKLSAQEKRGLREETLEEFKIGLEFNWTPPKTRKIELFQR